jgi:Planctomycete cytochrome C
LPGPEEIELVPRFVIMASLVFAMGCSGVEIPDVPAGVPVTYSEHIEPLVIARCLSCHTTEEPEAQLVFEVGVGYGQMVSRPSTQEPEFLMVAPGDVENSYLWRKLTHDVEIGRGMPRTVVGSIRLSDEEIELYRRWIEDGALP